MHAPILIWSGQVEGEKRYVAGAEMSPNEMSFSESAHKIFQISAIVSWPIQMSSNPQLGAWGAASATSIVESVRNPDRMRTNTARPSSFVWISN